MHCPSIRLALALLAVSAAARTSSAQGACLNHDERKLRPADSIQDNRFGHALAVRGDVAVVGAYNDDGVAPRSGSVYVYRRVADAWELAQKLTAPSGSMGDGFGFSIATDGLWIAVGTPGDDAGAVHVFRFRSGEFRWSGKLLASDGESGDELGYSVAVDDGVVLSGALFDTPAGFESGSAYVHRFDGVAWVQEQKLSASDAQAADNFGFAVSLDGDQAVVGAAQDTGSGPGKAYVFRRTGTSWAEVQRIVPSDTAQGDQYGWATFLRGDSLLVGAPGKDMDRGAAYVHRFDGSSWVEAARLDAPDRATFDRFGNAVAIEDDVALVAAFGDDTGASRSGAAYHFEREGDAWSFVRKLGASFTIQGDLFGAAVGLSGRLALVGNEPVGRRGTAYDFELAELGLHADPRRPLADEDIEFLACGGTPQATALLVLVEADGRPVFRRLATGNFDADGAFTVTRSLNASLIGSTLFFQVLELSGSQPFPRSNRFRVRVQ